MASYIQRLQINFDYFLNDRIFVFYPHENWKTENIWKKTKMYNEWLCFTMLLTLWKMSESAANFRYAQKWCLCKENLRYIINVRAFDCRMTWTYVKYDVIHTIRWANNFLIGIRWGAWFLDCLRFMWCHYSTQVVGIYRIAKKTKHLSRVFHLIAKGAS